MDEGAGERELLPHAPGEALAALAPAPPEAEAFEQTLGRALGRSGLDRPQSGDELEIFERVELVVEHRLVGQPGDDALGLDRILARVDAEDADVAAVGLKKAGDHAQGRRLPGAVGSEQGVEFTRRHPEIQPVHRGPGKTLPERAEFEGGDAFNGHLGSRRSAHATGGA